MSPETRERLRAHYEPLIRTRAGEIRQESGRLSHHNVWFPLIDAYEPKPDETVFRPHHKEVAREIFLEWCQETQVTPAGYWGELGHNLLGFARGAAAIGGVAVIIMAVAGVGDKPVGVTGTLVLVGFGLLWLSWQLLHVHARYQETVMRRRYGEGDAEKLLDDLNKKY